MFPGKTFFCSLYKSTYRNHAGSEFLNSLSSKYVNPRSHVHSSDTVLKNFNADLLAGMDDRKILSLFTLGFFGGFIFSPEGMLLRAGAWNLLPVHFTSRFILDFQSPFRTPHVRPKLMTNTSLSQHHSCSQYLEELIYTPRRSLSSGNAPFWHFSIARLPHL